MTLVVDTNEAVDRSYSRLHSSKKIAELSLQKINAFSVNDTAADPAHLSRALLWLDLIVAEIAGTNKCFFLIQRDLELALDADAPSYDIADALGAQLPAGGIQFVISARLVDSAGNETPVELIEPEAYEALSNKDTSGAPDRAVVDRVATQTIKVYPVPAVSTYTLKLAIATFAPDQTKNNGETQHGLTAAWQLWMVNALAAEIGDGPIRRLNANTIQGMRQMAELLRNRLLNWNNQERPGQGQPRRTAAWGV